VGHAPETAHRGPGGQPRWKEYAVNENVPSAPGSGLLVAVEVLTVVHDRNDTSASDPSQGGGGDGPWPRCGGLNHPV
jgi:hypothetical protein